MHTPLHEKCALPTEVVFRKRDAPKDHNLRSTGVDGVGGAGTFCARRVAYIRVFVPGAHDGADEGVKGQHQLGHQDRALPPVCGDAPRRAVTLWGEALWGKL